MKDIKNKIIILGIIISLLYGCGKKYTCLMKQNTKEIIAIIDNNYNDCVCLNDTEMIKMIKNDVVNNYKISKELEKNININTKEGFKLLFISFTEDTVCVIYSYKKNAIFYQYGDRWYYSDVEYNTGRNIVEIFDTLYSGATKCYNVSDRLLCN